MYDTARGRIVQVNSPTYLNEWNGHGWESRSVVGPEIYYFSAAYDTRRNCIILFGGENWNSNVLSGTWSWDGQTWTQLSNQGPAREGAHMAYDEERDRIVMWGGWPNGTSQQQLTDTWEWDGASWQQRATTSGVAPAAVFYDRRTHRVESLAGSMTSGLSLWTWDGIAWSATQGSLAGRAYYASAYDGTRDLPIVFGGFIAGPLPVNSIEALRPPGPVIVGDPSSVSVTAGSGAQFCVQVSSAGAHYEWRRDHELLTDGPEPTGGFISGATTMCLQISGVTVSDTGIYDCRVSDGCGQVYSHSAWLRVAEGATRTAMARRRCPC